MKQCTVFWVYLLFLLSLPLLLTLKTCWQCHASVKYVHKYHHPGVVSASEYTCCQRYEPILQVRDISQGGSITRTSSNLSNLCWEENRNDHIFCTVRWPVTDTELVDEKVASEALCCYHNTLEPGNTLLGRQPTWIKDVCSTYDLQSICGDCTCICYLHEQHLTGYEGLQSV